MSSNLFINLFKYRPRPNRKPLEDFTTECFAHLMRIDENLLKEFLNLILKQHKVEYATSMKVDTQKVIGTGHRIDLVVSWSEHGDRYDLFIENKIDAIPWEKESEEGEVDSQIDAYCRYQHPKNQENNRHFVALISPHLIKNYSQQDKLKYSPTYCGNFLWKDIKQIIQKRSVTSVGAAASLEVEFVAFLRRFQMAAFEELRVSDLASMIAYSSMMSKLNALTNTILRYFDSKNSFFEAYDLKRTESWGAQKYGYHYGVIYHDENDAADSSLWILFGLSTSSPPSDDAWFVEPLLSDELIPDIECALYVWFDDQTHRKSFFDRLGLDPSLSWDIEENAGFKLSSSESPLFLALVKRQSLLEYVGKGEDSFLDFLESAFNKMAQDGQTVNKFIKTYQATKTT